MENRFHKVLVTGGAGFIGSHLVDSMVSRGIDVRIVDNLSSGNLKNIGRGLDGAGVEFVQGDLKDLDTASRSVCGVEAVFHLAANPEVRVAEVDPSIHLHENLLTTFSVIEAMRKSETAGVMVFFSSSTVYGEPKEIPTPEDYGPLVPISVYGASKLGCEALISSYCYTFGMRGLVFRLANIVGGRSRHGVIMDFVRKLRENPRKLEILGDGSQSKSYLYVGNLVDAVFLALESFLENRETIEVYNVGSSDQVNVRRIAEIVADEMGLQGVKFDFTGGVDGGRGWKGDVKTMLLSADKLLSLGWKPGFNSEEAVRMSCRELLRSLENRCYR
jgi:UDP-glucose 4-epimerase